VREDDAGGGGFGVAVGIFIDEEERVSGDDEEAGETIAGGKGDVGVAVRE